MKRFGNLYDSIISLENLQLADEKARKGKVHSYGVQLHDKNRESNLMKLHESLKNQTFKTSKYMNPKNVRFLDCRITRTESRTMQL